MSLYSDEEWEQIEREREKREQAWNDEQARYRNEAGEINGFTSILLVIIISTVGAIAFGVVAIPVDFLSSLLAGIFGGTREVYESILWNIVRVLCAIGVFFWVFCRNWAYLNVSDKVARFILFMVFGYVLFLIFAGA